MSFKDLQEKHQITEDELEPFTEVRSHGKLPTTWEWKSPWITPAQLPLPKFNWSLIDTAATLIPAGPSIFPGDTEKNYPRLPANEGIILIDDLFVDEPTVEIKCTCGSEKTYGKGTTHSSWCDRGGY